MDKKERQELHDHKPPPPVHCYAAGDLSKTLCIIKPRQDLAQRSFIKDDGGCNVDVNSPVLFLFRKFGITREKKHPAVFIFIRALDDL